MSVVPTRCIAPVWFARVSTGARERFLSWPMAVGFALYGLFALTFSLFQAKGDALVYYNLLRKFFGEEPDFAYAYQFGSAVWNAPFFLVGKSFGIVFGFQPRIFHVSFEEISITLATNAASPPAKSGSKNAVSSGVAATAGFVAPASTATGRSTRERRRADALVTA